MGSGSGHACGDVDFFTKNRAKTALRAGVAISIISLSGSCFGYNGVPFVSLK